MGYQLVPFFECSVFRSPLKAVFYSLSKDIEILCRTLYFKHGQNLYNSDYAKSCRIFPNSPKLNIYRFTFILQNKSNLSKTWLTCPNSSNSYNVEVNTQILRLRYTSASSSLGLVLSTKIWVLRNFQTKIWEFWTHQFF